MKIYKYQNGARIEASSSQEPPEVAYTMGEYHVGEPYMIKTFRATNANGQTKSFSNWGEAYKFILA